MPTYDYQCENCDHKFEKFESITAKPARKCPNCGKMKLNRLIGTGAGIIFKGSGFYQTDYRTDNYNKGKTAASSDSKPTATATKSEKKATTTSEKSKTNAAPKAKTK
ncbi:MAG: zinc ribbon domain-containing protein [Anaerohalosphaera sp.]|nr:zinc ribbon domain-containing protein [Anaerohalosphaera sp.]